jgi:hypothetical protein
MADKPKYKPHDDNDADSQQSAGASQHQRIHELTWALIDDLITEEEMAALDGLLRTEDGARNEYVRCVQLHADLQSHFAAKPSPTKTTPTARTPVLGSLQSEIQPLGLQLPPAEEVKS